MAALSTLLLAVTLAAMANTGLSTTTPAMIELYASSIQQLLHSTPRSHTPIHIPTPRGSSRHLTIHAPPAWQSPAIHSHARICIHGACIAHTGQGQQSSEVHGILPCQTDDGHLTSTLTTCYNHTHICATNTVRLPISVPELQSNNAMPMVTAMPRVQAQLHWPTPPASGTPLPACSAACLVGLGADVGVQAWAIAGMAALWWQCQQRGQRRACARKPRPGSIGPHTSSAPDHGRILHASSPWTTQRISHPSLGELTVWMPRPLQSSQCMDCQ